MTDAFIAFFSALAVAFSILVLTLRQPMRAALALVAHMSCLAAIFACLGVHAVALFQVLIYVGAVMVFMVYTIMLLDVRDAAYRERYSRGAMAGLVVGAAVAVGLLVLVARLAVLPETASGIAADFTFHGFSIRFIREYAFHFEVATVLLLAGMAAAWTAIREAR